MTELEYPAIANTDSLLAMLMRHLKAIILITTLFSCSFNQKTTKQTRFFPISSADTTLDYDLFSIIVPTTWRKPNDDTLPKTTSATAFGRIQIGTNEFIWYSYGIGADDYSKFPVIQPTADREIYIKYNDDTSYVIFSDNPKTIDSSRLSIHRVWYEQISGFRTKFLNLLKLVTASLAYMWTVFQK